MSTPTMARISLSALVLLQVLAVVLGHGRLRQPPGRSTMWRDGFPVPENYMDNQLNCGGRWIQWDAFGGKCGECGDPWNSFPQDNQPPYGKGLDGRDHGQRFMVLKNHKKVEVNLEIPAGLTCTQCVLQWRYVAGTSPKLGEDGRGVSLVGST
ncbi:uncharacterized protein LOC106013054 [Aplysia californica]|uniref:Uncharacterized protein LOC106013054 n=1 Tax=Aplysia californica TaxID=6500 RepID=A0ABM1A970_APLCA|nr:uncharacterized protein LOC106013054 [Aplysia californica]